MAQFNLEDYETVEERIKRFYADWPDGRIVSYELTDKRDREKGYWVVRAQVFLDHDDQHAGCPKASGMAFEIEGTAGANKTASLENAETSAIGQGACERRLLGQQEGVEGRNGKGGTRASPDHTRTGCPGSVPHQCGRSRVGRGTPSIME
jgi:hypothetical protein